MFVQPVRSDASVTHDRAVISIPTSKVIFDKVFAGFALIMILPAMLLIAGVILVLEGRPVWFGHERVGLNGRRFQCWKFRTMVRDADARLEAALCADPKLRAEWDATRKLKRDPRISRLGHFLRKTSLDEFPQFFNILKGDMSVVGPRPVVPDELAYYGAFKSDYTSVRPGLTGAWQVSGRSNTTYDERVALDIQYIENASLWRDVVIIWKTLGVVVVQDGAR